MSRSFLRPVPALVFALAAGAAPLAAVQPTLAPAQVAALKAQQPARTAKAQAELTRLAPQLGLAAVTGFLPHQATTNAQGRTVVRFHQTHEGHRVWAGEAIAHVEPDDLQAVCICLLDRKQMRYFLNARWAIRRPKIKHNHFSAIILQLLNIAAETCPAHFRKRLFRIGAGIF